MRMTTDQIVEVTNVNIRRQKSGPEDLLALEIDCCIPACPLTVAAEAFSCSPEDLDRLFSDDGEPALSGVTVEAPNQDFAHDLTLGTIEDRASAVRKIKLKPTDGRRVCLTFQVQISDPNDATVLEACSGLIRESISIALKSRQLEVVDGSRVSAAA